MSPRRSVLVVIGFYQNFTGSQRVAAALAEGLADRVDARFLVLGEGQAADALRDRGHRVEVVETPPPFAAFHGAVAERSKARTALDVVRSGMPFVARLRGRIGAAAPDVVHCNDLRALVFAGPAARTLRMPVLWYMQGDQAIRRRRARRAVATLPWHIATVADFLSDQYRGMGVPVSTIRAFVDPAVAGAEASAAAPTWGEVLGLAPDASPIVLVTASSLMPYKGLHHVPEALAELFYERPDLADRVHWAYLGGADTDEKRAYASALEARADALGVARNVHGLGYRDDAIALIGAADALVVPTVARETIDLPGLASATVSSSEGIPLSIYEAQSVGTPVIASSLPGMVELADERVLLVPPSEPRALASALRCLIDAPPSQTPGAVGAAPASSVSIDAFAALYERLAVAPTRRAYRSGAAGG